MSNKEVAIRFIDAWRINPQRLDTELESLSNETHRRPDNFYFEISEDGLVDPQTKRPVKNFIDRYTSLGSSEFRFLETLEGWAKEDEEGTGLWISPPYLQKYPCAKAIFYQVAYSWEGGKVLTSSAVLFDATSKECNNLASEISGHFFEDSEKLRESLLVLDDTTITTVLDKILKNHPKKNFQSVVEQRPNVEVFARMIRGKVPSHLVYQEMQRSGFLGEYPISCPISPSESALPTFSEYSISRSRIASFSETAKFVKRCGSCGKEINAFIAKGYRCSNCGGIYEGC